MEMVKNLATAEQVAKELRSQLDAKDNEYKRFRAESMSNQKRLEKVRLMGIIPFRLLVLLFHPYYFNNIQYDEVFSS